MKHALWMTLTLFCAAAAFGQCPTTDDTTVQATLDSTAAAGGGTVQLDPRVYNLCQPLILGSNVHLRGAGRGATVLRGAATATCKTVSSATVCAMIGSVATNDTSISDLTIDNYTNAHDSNGIEFVPAGAAFDGVVPTNALVQRVEVIGTPGPHDYMIWNLRGQHVKIVDNWIDGKTTTNTNQEGIESYGGYDVVIANNTVRNMGTSGINLGSAGVTNSETVGVFATNNYLEQCQFGVHVGTSSTSGDQYNASIHVRGNVIRSSRMYGIDVSVMTGTHEYELDIVDNTIRDVTATLAAGIHLAPNSGSIAPSSVLSTTVEGNLIASVRGSNALGISIVYPNARIVGNTVIDTDYQGIYAVDSPNLEIVRNRVERSGSTAIQVVKSTGDISSLVIDGNALADWSSAANGMLIIGAHNGAVRNNSLRRSDTATPGAISIDSSSCGVTVLGNVAWYLPGFTNTSTAACP